MSVNKVILVGRLGRDPETRFTGGGQAVANFSMATDETYKDRNGVKQKKTEWHKLVAWGKLAEIVQKFLTKGSLIYIEGTLHTREWQDKEGVKKYTTEITAYQMRMLGGGDRRQPADGDADSGPAESYNHQGTGGTAGPEISDEDIPF